MKWFLNMKIGTKMITGFLVIALLSAAMGVFALINIRALQTSDTELHQNMLVPTEQMASINQNFLRQRVQIRQALLSDDPEVVEAQLSKIETMREEADGLDAAFEAKILSDRMRQLFDEYKAAKTAYRPLLDQAIEYIRAGRKDEAAALLADDGAAGMAAFAEMEAIENVMAQKVTDGEDKAADNTAQADNVTMITIIVMGAVLVLSVTIGILIARIISKPVKKIADGTAKLAQGQINIEHIDYDARDEIGQMIRGFNDTISNLKGYIYEISEVLGEVAKGNLNVGIDSEYKGDFVALKDSINSIIESINEIMVEINTSANQVSAGTQQVSSGSQEISQGAAEQASAIEELTASVTQITEQTRLNAESASEASQLTNGAKDNAEQGNDQMKAMQKAMADINESSENISKIIKVIDDIAFQTNILALNAAVEAARAGVHGKGFAVVAEEVRNLAAKSADAARQTTDLIEGSIRKAEAGTKIADETAEALTDIVSGVEKAAQLVGEIASASNEQASAIAQVNSGIEQMSQVVQTNSATSEEAAAAAEELSSQAEMLSAMVGQFTLKSESTGIKKEAAAAEKKPVQTKEPQIALSDEDFGKY